MTYIKQNKVESPPVVIRLRQPVKLQFTSTSVQTHLIYVVKTLKEFNKKGKMEVFTKLT